MQVCIIKNPSDPKPAAILVANIDLVNVSLEVFFNMLSKFPEGLWLYALNYTLDYSSL